MYYPILMKLEGKKVVVVGGGAVAFQKLKTLEGTNAHITIISPSISKDIEQWLQYHEAKWICKPYEANDIEQAHVIFAATNDAAVNEAIRQDKSAYQLLLQAGVASKGDFILPAVVRRGKLSISISTDGASPSLTRKLKKQIDEQFDERFGDYVEFLGQARQLVMLEINDAKIKKNCLKRLIEPIFYDLTIQQKWQERDSYLQQVIEEEMNK